MFKKKECVAMLLAGGQGSRLYALTKHTAKPAVQFGGKYRIIDFPLSNCVNSGIDTVGVLTQYQPLVLNDYMGNGLPWDLDRTFGGLKILPPYQGNEGADWYRGTANAIYQNLEFIDMFDPEYVLVLSGDHIYKMDYSKMLDCHKRTGASCTIAVLEVPLEEASRFGIMTTDESGRIVRFTEKPAHPESTKASMGIYIFDRHTLTKYLEEDEADKSSSNDFGKNVIPAMLAAGESMYAYAFDGYWKDVGTINSLWEANMDMLGTPPKLELGGDSWRIYSRHYCQPPQYIGGHAIVENSVVTEGCEIYGTVKNCVLGAGVRIMHGAYVKDTVIMDNVTVGEGATVNYSIIDSQSVIGAGTRIGAPRGEGVGIAVIGTGVHIPSGAEVFPGDMIS